MSNTNTPEQPITDDHRLSIGELRKLNQISENIMFDLTNEEFEKMMDSVDSSVCIEPLYFPTFSSDYETQSVHYY